MTIDQTKLQSSDAAPASMLGHIFGSHIERIGVTRTLAGGLSMYLCIPLLIVGHLTLAVALYQWILRPLLGTARIQWKDYVIIDRHRIRELTSFDKFNCMFCGYANGLCTMINVELDNAAAAPKPLGLMKKLLLAVVMLAYLPLYLGAELGLQIIYNILVSRPLGMHRVSIPEMRAVMNDGKFADGHWAPFRSFLRALKSVFGRFAVDLEQIESSWCPLTHFERRQGVVYPAHHAKFFGPDELEEMRETLRTHGTVSERRPRY
jgi:hypothetical protein